MHMTHSLKKRDQPNEIGNERNEKIARRCKKGRPENGNEMAAQELGPTHSSIRNDGRAKARSEANCFADCVR
jgi:hypothetical protein